jgi:hypothetical protein
LKFDSQAEISSVAVQAKYIKPVFEQNRIRRAKKVPFFDSSLLEPIPKCSESLAETHSRPVHPHKPGVKPGLLKD